MENSKPILRVGKIKKTGRSTLQSVSGHLARTKPTPNADPSRTGKNQWIIGNANLASNVNKFMRDHGIDPDKTRKDAVVANDILLTISPEWFRPDDPEAGGTWDENRLMSFKAEAHQMLRKTFGTRCVAAVLHLDEATPHIQAVIVPVIKTENGLKLSSKEMFGPTQLTQLQQDWEDRMMPHGVGPREKRSRAKHTTLREYYGALDDYAQKDLRNDIDVSNPPKKRIFDSAAQHDQKLKNWKNDENKRLRKELQPLAVDAAKGRLFDSEKRAKVNAISNVHFQRDMLEKQAEELEITKDLANKLRSIPVKEIALKLGFTGTIQKNENAIDLTKRLGELTYRQAVTWLAQNFGSEAAATAAREHTLKALEQPQERVLSAGEVVKGKIIKEQLTALSADEYRITIMMERNGKKVGMNLGTEKLQKDLLTKQEVLDLIPDMTLMNLKGGNVFVTPIDSKIEHILIDDLKGQKLQDFINNGYAPAILQETSPENFQAIIKIPKSDSDKSDRNEMFKDLNRAYGDEKITGLVHPIRLAGFENRKEKHLNSENNKYPFVKIKIAANRLCQKAIDLIKEYQTRRTQKEAQINAEQERQRLEQQKRKDALEKGYSRPRMR